AELLAAEPARSAASATTCCTVVAAVATGIVVVALVAVRATSRGVIVNSSWKASDMRFAIITCLVFAACGDNGGTTPTEDNDPFDTYQACFDEHHGEESFPTQMAIEICCIDHPIGDQPMNVVCGNTAQACETYVTANLNPADASADVISAA